MPSPPRPAASQHLARFVHQPKRKLDHRVGPDLAERSPELFEQRRVLKQRRQFLMAAGYHIALSLETVGSDAR
jgi:hypothetical protein